MGAPQPHNKCCCDGKCLCCIGKRQPLQFRLTISGVGGGGCCNAWNATFDLSQNEVLAGIDSGCIGYTIDLTGTELAACFPNLRILLSITCYGYSTFTLSIHEDYIGKPLVYAEWRHIPILEFFAPMPCNEPFMPPWIFSNGGFPGGEETGCNFEIATVSLEPL